MTKPPTSTREPSPDRPIRSALNPLRRARRQMRLLRLQVVSGGRLSVGDNVAIGRNATILCPNFFRAGDDVRIGMDFLAEVDVTIGPGVLVSSRVSLIGNDHEIPPAGTPLFTAGRRPCQHIVMEGDNLIGHGTLILGSVTIGYGAVVGAGSLVLTDIPPNTIYAGRPASLLRCRENADLAAPSR